MLSLEVSEYLSRTSTGRSKPMKCICQSDTGEEFQVYLKCVGFHDELTSDHLVAELVANLFAIDLGLPAAMPCVVKISTEFIDTLPFDADGEALRAALSQGPQEGFGSVAIDPVRRWEQTDLVHTNQLNQAAQLFLFDSLVENSDRGLKNPNLLMSGFDFKVIDFGHCFPRCHQNNDFNGSRFPWEPTGIMNHMPGDMQHIMYPKCRGLDQRYLADFTKALEDLSDDAIQNYITKVPQGWCEDTACRIIEFLIEARENASKFAEQAKGVLG